MKIGKQYIGVLLSLLTFTLSASARTFVAGEEIYVNSKQDYDWTKDNAKLYLYLFDGSRNEWIELVKENGAIYKAVIKQACSYSQCIVVRGSAPNWDSKWSQTEDMDIPDGWNCIDNFKDGAHRWKMYTPLASRMNSFRAGVTEEKIQVCESALGALFSLKAKLNSTKSDYDYSNVKGHGWFSSTDGSSWSSIDQFAGIVRDGEQNIDTFAILPATLTGNGIYYFLYSTQSAGRRLIHITADAPNCELDCEITSFETAISAVNADNNTYTLDGMVAFGKASGTLVVECDGQSLRIDDPKSPQSFSLYGVPAATENGKKTLARAYFEGDQDHCSKTIEIAVPNATEAVKEIVIESAIGLPVTLTPTNTEPTNVYVWLAGKDTLYDAPQVLELDTFWRDTTVVYTYKEYYPASGSMEDMMANGHYEDQTWDYGTKGQPSTMSEYNFWGKYEQTDMTAINFYQNTVINPGLAMKYNGFAVVRNANNFAPTFAKVEAREGKNFGLFDAESGEKGANKKAWYATTAQNEKLKLHKGTTYVLSFWAANINNYGEMNNAARFVFRIEYNGKTWESNVLDLSKPEFLNNIWHQHSETFYAEEDCENVTISVVNKNNNVLNIGNDFALDDIQFHPISSVSRVVKSQQQFVVHVHKPEVFMDTICKGESYSNHGFSVTAPEVGNHEYINAIKDTLRLTVGDADAMYSKWSDVLFVENKDQRYVGFQWFENGMMLPGETQQRLYKPEGLPGVYMCEMTTSDGSRFVTCSYRFDQVPRSADNTPEPAQIIRQYRVGAHFYIVQVRVGDEIHTTKIITPYE